MASEPSLQTCVTCNNTGVGDPASWHHYMHPFKGATDPPSRPQSDEPATPGVRVPFDPVLRQALIDKGVLTIDDLRNAEAKIMVVSGEFHTAVREAMNDDGATARTSGSRVWSRSPTS
jgi:hypothetical protein